MSEQRACSAFDGATTDIHRQAGPETAIGLWVMPCGNPAETSSEVDLQGASNNASAQKTCRPPGCAQIGLGHRCSAGRRIAADTLPPSRLAPGQYERNE